MPGHDEPDRVELVAICATPGCKWQRIYTPNNAESVRRAVRDLRRHDDAEHYPERTGLRLLNPCPGPLRRCTTRRPPQPMRAAA